ncbi:MAG: hypothetical protein A4E20_04730 [Nitrospira sp. SG-bin2]|uniref:hypothetical protein n=1 Tax=Nitrospira cf. moscoviensis SBR1015 TaxID=96242 RepID=UPI000A0E0E79|nr:hypothetical protein [Nitrospira cf. moscoviensis SBR1015]OQW38082.1 MAG: hypothetical protein A4E20_04730 [Nitrospira sp. SG-bin2]
MTEQEVTKRAEESGRIINSPAYQQAWTEVEKDIVRQWMQARTPEDREDCWHKVQALKALHRELNGFLEQGKSLERKKQRRNGNANWSPA